MPSSSATKTSCSSENQYARASSLHRSRGKGYVSPARITSSRIDQIASRSLDCAGRMLSMSPCWHTLIGTVDSRLCVAPHKRIRRAFGKTHASDIDQQATSAVTLGDYYSVNFQLADHSGETSHKVWACKRTKKI